MNSSWEMCECMWSFVSRIQCGALPPGRPKGLLQNLDENVNKCMSMCLVGVTVIAHCRLMCSVGYGMNSSWEMWECK